MKSPKFLSLTLGLLLLAALASSTNASWQPDTRLSVNLGRSGLSPGNTHCVAADAFGNIHIVWHDDTSGNYEIQYVTFDSLTAWPPVPRQLSTNSGTSHDPSIAVAPDTSIFVVWSDNSGSLAPSINFVRFYPHVATVLDSGLVSTGTLACSGPCVAAAGDGSVHVAWVQNTGRTSNIFYRKWDNGWVSDPLDISSSSGTCVSASVAADGIGNVHVAWADNVADNYEIFYRKFTAGSGWGGVFQVSKSAVLAWSPSIGADRDGNVYVVWSDKRDGNFEIYVRRYLEGVGWGNEKRMSYNPAISSNPCAAVDVDGNLHVVWEDYRYGNEEIYYRCVSSREGPGWDPVETRLTNDPATSWDPSVAVDPSGNLHVVWADNRDLNFEIYYKFGLKPVTVDVELLAFYAECTEDGVLLRWEMGSEASTALVDVYRKDDDADSSAKISRDPLFAEKQFLDTRVDAGATYQYFIGIWENQDGDQMLFGPVSITYKPPVSVNVPRLVVWPNPFTGPLKVEFAAEGENTPFKLTLLDVNGRVVAEMASGVTSSRVTSFPWDPARTSDSRLSPGIYFVSLETGGKRVEKKIVFLK